MIHWRSATVTEIRSDRPGVREVIARLEDPLPGGGDAPVRALAYTELVGTPELGDRILLNVSALARGLGTGGYALIIAVPDRLPADPPPGPGHLVKDRYQPLQTMVLGVDDQESPHHAALAEADDLAGMPVLVADLHSALPAIIAGVRAERPHARISYVLTDGAALPLRFSRSVAGLADAGWLTGSISTGQAWGGDLEAVSVHSGLLAARHVQRADITIVSQGPGNLGTGTAFGFSGIVVGDHLDAAAALGGRAIGVLRVSGADRRERHYGISHHTTTVLERVARPGVILPVPVLADSALPVPDDLAERIDAQLAALTARHTVVRVDGGGLDAALASSPVGLSTMGRGLEQDPAAFLAAAAAGRHAATLLD